MAMTSDRQLMYVTMPELANIVGLGHTTVKTYAQNYQTCQYLRHKFVPGFIRKQLCYLINRDSVNKLYAVLLMRNEAAACKLRTWVERKLYVQRTSGELKERKEKGKENATKLLPADSEGERGEVNE